jgi:aerobic carbon-monoxide dehydrogenase small subunit
MGQRMAEVARVALTVNGAPHEAFVEARKLLSDFLREDLGLTGTHVGCEHGVCGACTIFLNGQTVRSCLMLAVQADGAEITTVEGLARGDQLSPLQQAFWRENAFQCGYCTPGMLITATELLARNPTPTEAEIREGIASVLCRCTGYEPIVRAVQVASAQVAAPAAPGDAGARSGE